MDQEENKKKSEDQQTNSDLTTDLEKEIDNENFESISLDLTFDDEKKEKAEHGDELWDPASELDDVSLFDEFASEIAEIEKTEKEKAEKKPFFKDDEGLSSLIEEEKEKTSEPLSQQKEESDLQPETKEKLLIPIIVSMIAFLFLLAGIFTIWEIIITPFSAKKLPTKVIKQLSEVTPHQNELSQELNTAKKEKKTAGNATADNIPLSIEKNDIANKLPNYEMMTLSSFMIPATQNGQLVFFNIQISIMLSDINMKKEFIKRETRLRDTIYRELKGADLSEGINENTLIMFRKPLMDKINKEYDPLKIEDIKLTGYILK